MSETKSDVYRMITDKIIAAIEAGAEQFIMPWNSGGGCLTAPANVDSGKVYRGVNRLMLWIASESAGYASGIWGTYKQFQERGAQVRKGEKSTHIVFWNFSDKGKEEASGDDEKSGRKFFAKSYNVFNASQVDGYEMPVMPIVPGVERDAQADAFFAGIGADIRHEGHRAFYRPGDDVIGMPPFGAFTDAAGYYSVLAHEATHWTAHKNRCDRDLNGRFGSDAYAAEELVAELGAAFLCGDLGLSSEPRPDHAAYIATWLKVLREDKRAIFSAASAAQKAVDYLHAQQPGVMMRAA